MGYKASKEACPADLPSCLRMRHTLWLHMQQKGTVLFQRKHCFAVTPLKTRKENSIKPKTRCLGINGRILTKPPHFNSIQNQFNKFMLKV